MDFAFCGFAKIGDGLLSEVSGEGLADRGGKGAKRLRTTGTMVKLEELACAIAHFPARCYHWNRFILRAVANRTCRGFFLAGAVGELEHPRQESNPV